ncbi:hypothetical protein EAI_11890 [Harpegnathos saltator]|uniref:Uncharacterized protein n=1 Tax=Harpegnathos saltator TaxID=610380 RepID=E2BTV9_HARSA|nr:hypothetical protein EAI_11890 [Harpegnathos saltator]
MPAEIDTGGPRVLQCDSRADWPTTPINAPTSAGRRAERAHSSCRSANSLADLAEGSPARLLPRIHGGGAEAVGCSPADEPGSTRTWQDPRPRKVESRRRRRGTAAAEEAGSPSGRDGGVLAESRASTPPTPTRGANGLTCLAPGGVSRALENVSKDECLSVTRNSRESGARGARGKVERAESRLRDETERSPLAIAAAVAGSGCRAIARRRSLQDRSWTRPLARGEQQRPAEARDSIARPRGETRAAAGGSLLSSQHSRSRAKVRSCEGEDRAEADSSERVAGEGAGEDARTDASPSGCSGRDERLPGEIPSGGLHQRRRRGRGAAAVRSFLRLAFLLLLVALGRSGPSAWSVRSKFSARPLASCVSVLAIGAIIGAVSAAPVDPLDDAGIRAERSANLSHITGTSRKIQMYVKNRHLQILPDGTVNGSNDDTSDYSEYCRFTYSSSTTTTTTTSVTTTTTTLAHAIAR